MIQSKQLSKSFGDFKAVQNLDLEIEAGQCFGLLGPNGAGKSTFINMLYGLVRRTGGELTVFGMDPEKRGREVKKRLGVVTQDNALDESLTVYENMMVYAAFLGVEKSARHARVVELLTYMQLDHKQHAPIRALSGGMKRRLVFVRALLGKPELLILDEPTTGLDPAVRHLLWGKVKELREAGTTILLTTHYMHEAEVLCDRLVILNQGQIVARGTPQDMIREHTPGFVGIYNLDSAAKVRELANRESGWKFHEDSSGVYLRTQDLASLTGLHSSESLNPLQIRPANLEDVFLKLTGQELAKDA